MGFKIEGDFTASPSLTDGYIDLRLLGPAFTLGTGFEFKPFGNPELALRGGQFKAPFSPEELESDIFIPFIERSLVNQLAPSRDVGFMVYGQLFDRVLGYNVGLFNGSGLNAPDTTNEKMFAGRVVLAPFRNSKNVWLKGLQLGVDVTVGDSENNQSARGQTTGRTNPRFQFFASQPTRGDRYRWGADLWWLVGPASLRLEYDQQRDQRKHVGPGGSDLADVVATGFYVSGSFLLTGEDAVINGPAILNWSQYWYDTQLGTPFSCNQAACGAGNLKGRGNSNYEIQTRLQLWF